MRQKNSGLMATSLFLVVFFWLAVFVGVVGYIMNIVKFEQLDFEEPYKAEVVRTVGLIPIVGIFTGYMTFEEEQQDEP